MGKINKASLSLLYDGTDISKEIASYLSAFSITSVVGGKADDLQITLENRDGLWTGAWFPTKGAILTPRIECSYNDQKKALSCGTFAIDDIAANGPPDTIILKAVSSLTAKAFKREKKSKQWENISLAQIAKDIADGHGLTLWMDAEEPPVYTRRDQREQSDLSFLHQLCRDEDLNLKLTGQKIVISQGKKLEDAAPVVTLERGASIIDNYSFSSSTFDIYKACQVSYFDAETKTEKLHTFTPPGAPDVGQILKINQRVESISEAISKAKGALRRKNRQEITGKFTIMGNPAYQAGLTINGSGFGIFDGKYLIEESRHFYTRSAGYKTTCRNRKVLNW